MKNRLSPTVRPSEIALHFELDPREKTFRGEASYAIELERRTRKLELHAAELRISRIRARMGEEELKPRLESRPETETVVLHFDRLLPAESIRLDLRFRGRVRNDLRGLYRSVDEEMPWLATQLCPTDARRLFPCFDEPGIKAHYRISVTAPTDQSVISNAPVLSVSENENDSQTIEFERTPPLSAYLIAIAVGPFTSSPKRTSGSTEIRVHTLPGGNELAAFAAEAAVESLSRLEAWFDMAHPYPKLDLVALPDFAFGAMENAGAVFFRDSILLLDEAEASIDDRKRAGETIAHELSHMWFGNLVTMAWWNDLWLNESFATWMAYEIIHAWRPEWQIWCDFAHRRESALEVDALATSHPVAPKIRSAEEAHENFDAITYTKGACVLRMLEGYLGPDVFRDGVRLYIRRHLEADATADDLWSALGEVSGLDVESIVSPWTLRTGYPLIRVDRRQKDGIETIGLAQERFFALPPNARKSKAAARWTVPWVGRIGRPRQARSTELRHLLSKSRDRVSAGASRSRWLYGNANESGFFRLEHARIERADLLTNLSRLSAIERIGYVGHQWALARSGRLSIAELLELLAALGTEEDPDVLFAAESVLARLGRRLAPSRGPEIETAFRAWIAEQYGGQIQILGLSTAAGEEERTRMRRARAFSIVGHLAQDESIRRECVSLASGHLSRGESLHPSLAEEIIRIGAHAGDASMHSMLCESTERAETPQARRRTLFALAEFDAPKLIRASLRASLDPNLAPIPDRAALMTALLSRPTTANPTWKHLQKSWTRLESQMPPILLARLASATSEALPHSSATEIRKFFTVHPLAAGERILRQISEQMAIARRFETRAGEEFEAYVRG
jgi:puromycin-sensitive aminopeptidase